MNPIIKDFANLLSKEQQDLLTELFVDYYEVALIDKLEGGFSSAQVFVVRPMRTKEIAEIPNVIKVGPSDLIQKEYEAYHLFAHRRISKSVRLEEPVVFDKKRDVGALRYILAGEGVDSVKSFAEFCRDATSDEISQIIEEKLSKIFQTLWGSHQNNYSKRLSFYYDNWLPVNYKIKYISSAPPPPSTTLSPDSFLQEIHENDLIEITNFVLEAKLPSGDILLNLPNSQSENQSYQSFRIMISGLPLTSNFTDPNSIPETFVGMVVETQKSFFSSFIEPMDLFSSGKDFPNPIDYLYKAKSMQLDFYTSPNHGDLNLQNILMTSDHKNIYLIDFALAKSTHVLQDLIHLEAEVIIHLVTEEFAHHNIEAVKIFDFLIDLHTSNLPKSFVKKYQNLEKYFVVIKSIRKAAEKHLTNMWDEYYLGLYFFLLVTLKFRGLNHRNLTTKIALLGASAMVNFIENPEKFKFAGNQTRKTYASPQSTNETKPNSGTSIQSKTFVKGNIYKIGDVNSQGGNIHIGPKNSK